MRLRRKINIPRKIKSRQKIAGGYDPWDALEIIERLPFSLLVCEILLRRTAAEYLFFWLKKTWFSSCLRTEKSLNAFCAKFSCQKTFRQI